MATAVAREEAEAKRATVAVLRNWLERIRLPRLYIVDDSTAHTEQNCTSLVPQDRGMHCCSHPWAAPEEAPLEKAAATLWKEAAAATRPAEATRHLQA